MGQSALVGLIDIHEGSPSEFHPDVFAYHSPATFPAIFQTFIDTLPSSIASDDEDAEEERPSGTRTVMFTVKREDEDGALPLDGDDAIPEARRDLARQTSLKGIRDQLFTGSGDLGIALQTEVVEDARSIYVSPE